MKNGIYEDYDFVAKSDYRIEVLRAERRRKHYEAEETREESDIDNGWKPGE